MSWIFGRLHVRCYFQQQGYIAGTYIRKDRFKEIINREPVEPLNTIESIPLHVVEEVLFWQEYMKMVHKAIGIPINYLGE